MGIPCDVAGVARTQRSLDRLLSISAQLVNRRLGDWSLTFANPTQVVPKRCIQIPLQIISTDPGCAVPVTHATSPSTTIRIAMTQHSKLLTTALIRYTISAVAFTLFHIVSSPQTPDNGLRFFVKSKYVLWRFVMVNVLTSCRKHPFYLNGRVVFLIFSQIVHGLLFLLRNVLLGRSVIGWKPANSVSPTVLPLVGFPDTS